MSICDSATPATPATPEPSPKVSASTQVVRMPMELAIRRFWVTARICNPNAVRFRTTSSRTNTAIANTMIQTRP